MTEILDAAEIFAAAGVDEDAMEESIARAISKSHYDDMDMDEPDSNSWLDWSSESRAAFAAMRPHFARFAAQNARMREALSRWQSYGCPDCGADCASANPPVSCCIMRETRDALGKAP